MSSTTFTEPAPGAAPSFSAQVDVPVPRPLREDADSMSTDAFLARYAPSTGPLRLRNWRCTDPHRPASRLGARPRNYQATIAVGDRIGTATAAAGGPVAALTAMLHDQGIAVEVLDFHQVSSGAGTATFIRGSDGGRDEWATGLCEDPTQSALGALVNCANRLASQRD